MSLPPASPESSPAPHTAPRPTHSTSPDTRHHSRAADTPPATPQPHAHPPRSEANTPGTASPAPVPANKTAHPAKSPRSLTARDPFSPLNQTGNQRTKGRKQSSSHQGIFEAIQISQCNQLYPRNTLKSPTSEYQQRFPPQIHKPTTIDKECPRNHKSTRNSTHV